MSEAVIEIKRWGNSLGFRIPAAIAKETGLLENCQARITVEDDHVLIFPLAPRRTSLKEKLSRFNPSRHGGEVMGSEAIGAEKWSE